MWPTRHKTKSEVVITYVITEGQRSFIRSVAVTGNPNFPAEALRKKLFARRCRPINPGFMSADTARNSLRYHDRGVKPNGLPDVVRDSLDPLDAHVAYH